MGGKLIQNHLSRSVDKVTAFVIAAEKGISRKVVKEDVKTLIPVKEHLRKISAETNSVENSIATIHAHLLYLKRKKVKSPQLDKTLRQLATTAKN